MSVGRCNGLPRGISGRRTGRGRRSHPRLPAPGVEPPASRFTGLDRRPMLASMIPPSFWDRCGVQA
eukprot:7560735-Lingulodinium_polyedra.AAC.1